MQIKKRPSMLRTAELVDACAGSWIGSMKRRSIRGFLMIAVIFLLAGCSSARPIPFQNTSHREIYSLNLGDLEKLQFYISGDVVAQYQDATGTKSLLLPGLTPGVATGAGPNWIKVSFRQGGVDVPFVTDPNQYDGRYWIATEVEGGQGVQKDFGYARAVFSLQGSSVQSGLRSRCYPALRLGRLAKTRRETQSHRGEASWG